MKQTLLAGVLILVPVAGFTGVNLHLHPAEAASASLGDLSPLKAIVSDVQKIAGTGNLVAAETRITDFETAWDNAESAMRSLNPKAWSVVDKAADAALSALRADSPDAAQVTKSLDTLAAKLEYPTPSGAAGGLRKVSGIAVTDASGNNFPCEEMLAAVSNALSASKLPDADKSSAISLQSKALERCNTDDDQHADEFSAQALAALNH